MRDTRQSGPKSGAAVARMSRATAVIAMLCCCSASQMRAQGTSAFTEVDHVRGVVINSVTREPVGRALVYSPDDAFATMTDDRGRFEFVFPRPEPEMAAPATNTQVQSAISIITPATNGTRPSALVARKIGYLPADEGVDISQASPAKADVTMVLVPESRIIGHVVVPGWDGFGKIQVDVYRRTINEGREQWDMVGTAGSRADGEFRIAALSSGSYRLFTQEHLDNDPLISYPRGPLIGYPPVYFPSASDFDSAAVIHLEAGETFQATMTPIKKPYYPVKIGFTQELPSPELEIKVWPQGHPGPGFTLGYNQREGQIQGSLPEGVYSLLVMLYGETALAGTLNMVIKGSPYFSASISLFPASSVTVNVTQEFQHTQLLLPENLPVGSVPAYNPRRPNYLQVSLTPEEQFSLALPASLSPPRGPEDESLIINNVMPGRYRVNANTPGIGYVAAINSGGTDLLRQPLVVGADAAIPPMEIVVRDDGAEVDGTIDLPSSLTNFNQAGTATYAVCFVSLDRLSDRLRVVFSVSDGQFTTPQLPPGSYRVLAMDRPGLAATAQDEEFLKRYQSKIQIIHVTAEQKLHLRLALISVTE